MKKYRITFLTVLACISYLHISAQILNISEVTTDGKIFSVPKESGQIAKYPCIDINSTLKIKINKSKLKDSAANYVGMHTPLPESRIKEITHVLSIRKRLIEEINIDPNANLQQRKAALNDVSTILGPIMSTIDSLPRDNSLRKNADFIFSPASNATSAGMEYTMLFDILQNEIDSIDAQYKKTVEDNKVYFRLGAFLNATPLHLNGFDAIKEGDYYLVPRFVTSISDSEKQIFNQDQALASTINTTTASELKSKLSNAANTVVNQILDSCKMLLEVPDSTLKSEIGKIQGLAVNLVDTIQAIHKYVMQINVNIASFVAEVKNTNDPGYYTNILNGSALLYQDIVQLQGRIQNILDDLNELNSAQLIPDITPFQKSFNSAEQMLNREINKIGQIFSSQLLNVKGTQNIQSSLLKLGDDVKKIPLENVPDNTTLNLLYTGRRAEGDQLYFKAVLGKTPIGSDSSTEKDIQDYQIGLYQIGLHNSIEAALLFVDNTSAQFPSKTEFQLDPSYSVLFKWGSRKSTAYNKLFEVGAGVNVATLDFKSDNSPEIGIGLVVSTFKDYLQIGYGRNMETDQWYWFFGLRLPLLGFNFNGTTNISSAGGN